MGTRAGAPTPKPSRNWRVNCAVGCVAICPVLLVLTRQNLPTLDRSRYASAEGLRRGAYVVQDVSAVAAAGTRPDLILLASGSELTLILAAAECRQAEGVAVRCVSMPSWDLFDAQAQSYRDDVLPPRRARGSR